MAKQELDVLNFLFNYYEVDSSIRNGKIFKGIIDYYTKEHSVEFYFNPSSPYLTDYKANIVLGNLFIHKFIFNEEYIDSLFQILNDKNYYMKSFIKDLIKELGNAKDKSQSETIIEKYLRLPMIHNITFDGFSKYTIQTSYGDYSFFLADKEINDKELIEYIRSGEHKNTCHVNATTLLNIYDDLYTITSLCRYYFVDYFYHSYEYVKHKKMVLDICSNMLMEKRQFDDLYSPREILFMRNDVLRRLYFDKVKGIKSELEDTSVLKCALYKQSLSLDKNPDEKKKVLEFNGVTNLQ